MSSAPSLGRRLVAGALLWMAVTILATALVLVSLFARHVEQVFDVDLADHLAELIALAEVNAEGAVHLVRSPSDPNFERPFSGWYWLLLNEDGTSRRSRSLWDQTLRVPVRFATTAPTSFTTEGPRGEPLRGLGRQISLPEANGEVTVIVTGPTAPLTAATQRFALVAIVTLGVLGLGLTCAVVAQVRYGLRPLHRLRLALAAIRAGQVERLENHFPAEVAPLVTELNALLAHNSQLVERARTQAANLAHALKTPLAVLRNEAERLPAAEAALLRRQTDVMAAMITRHLTRARSAGAAGHAAGRVAVAPVAESLARTLARVYQERQITFHCTELDGLIFRGEPEDLTDMLGNLMDNAGKWARTQVRIRGGAVCAAAPGKTNRNSGDRPPASGPEVQNAAPYIVNDGLWLEVADDGPGIAPERRREALQLGQRLDESQPGTGIGLSIVQDLAMLYAGTLELDSSSVLGGLSARLQLPGGSRSS